MEQRGLDTLAALCGGASKARMEENKSNTAPVQKNEVKPAVTVAPTPPPAPATQSVVAPVVQRSVVPASQPVSAPLHPPQQQPVTMDAQQWQALANAAAYGGGNQAAASAAMASILQAATQNPSAFSQPAADPNAVNAMQQVAYYQYLAAAQAQAQMQAHFAGQQQQQTANGSQGTSPPGTSPGSNVQPTFAMDPNAGAQFGFVAHPAANHFQMAPGTFLSFSFSPRLMFGFSPWSRLHIRIKSSCSWGSVLRSSFLATTFSR